MRERYASAGVQNERTRLAWQRTLLSGLACALLVARVLASLWVSLALAIALLALATTAVMSWLVIERYRVNHNALVARRQLPDAKTPFLVTVLVALSVVGALAYLVLI
jgi:uncharacterized membrane protein YidH (DUF202 family)